MSTSELQHQQTITLPATLACQVGRVFRLRPGARILVLDGSSWEYSVELTDLAAKGGGGYVVSGHPVETEQRVGITLYSALLKDD